MVIRLLTAVCLTLHCGFSYADESSTSEASEVSIQKYREVARSLLKQQAATDSKAAAITKTLPLIRLSQQLSVDPRLRTSAVLYKTHRSVVARLREVKRQAEADLRRHARGKTPAKVQLDNTVLAQLGLLPANRGNINRQNQNAGNNGANNLVAANDYAPQLIELIQRTISPRSWDVNGGNSTIQYWRPGMALVVSAPGSVHEEMGPLLQQLRQP